MSGDVGDMSMLPQQREEDFGAFFSAEISQSVLQVPGCKPRSRRDLELPPRKKKLMACGARRGSKKCVRARACLSVCIYTGRRVWVCTCVCIRVHVCIGSDSST